MREGIRRDPVGVARRDPGSHDAALWPTLQRRVCFGAHYSFIRASHVSDPHVELFALRVLRGLRVILGAGQLARPLVLEVCWVLLLTAKRGVAGRSIHVQQWTVNRV